MHHPSCKSVKVRTFLSCGTASSGCRVEKSSPQSSDPITEGAAPTAASPPPSTQLLSSHHITRLQTIKTFAVLGAFLVIGSSCPQSNINIMKFASAFGSFVTKRCFPATSRSYSSGGAFRSTLMMKAKAGQAEVVLVGCGAPNRGMGWYHAVQMLEGRCPSASLDFIVEPWFLGPGATGPGGDDFAQWQKEVTAKYGTQFFSSLKDLPKPEQPRLSLISGRTADNPRLLEESIATGCTTIYLEKPGAPTVTELQTMAQKAKEANVPVLMGYNKNVCKYVTKTREFAATIPGSQTTFVSNNAYANTPESLGECFERNAEGMLKNMAIHELALLVSFYDVTVENIASVTADKEFSSCQTLPGPSGKMFTDFDKIKFTIHTKTGTSVSVQADRCGGTDSFAYVSSSDGKELFRYYMPDEEDKVKVKELTQKYPTAMPYFFTQDPDYVTVKERVAKTCATGSPAEGIATIDIAVNTLRVAEYLTPLLQEQLK